MKKTVLAVVGLCLALAMAAPIRADTFTFTVSGTNAGEPVSGSAVFTTSANTVTVVLTNTLTGGINSVASALTGVAFVLTNNLGASLTIDLGRLINVAADGTFTDVNGSGADDLDWGNISATPPPNGATWNTGGSPNEAILPAEATYSSANSSIAGNATHNPFVYGSATLTFTGAGITSSTQVTSAVLYFGTAFTPFEASPGSPPPPPPPPPPPGVPEPSTLVLLGCGLLGMSGIARRKGMK